MKNSPSNFNIFYFKSPHNITPPNVSFFCQHVSTKLNLLYISTTHDLKDLCNFSHPCVRFVRSIPSFKDRRVAPLKVSKSTELILSSITDILLRRLSNRTSPPHHCLNINVNIPSRSHRPKQPNKQTKKYRSCQIHESNTTG